MFSHFIDRKLKDKQFVFGECHLKAKPANMGQRVVQCQQMVDYFQSNFQDVPVFIAGDFNEEPQNDPIAKVMASGFVDLHAVLAQTLSEVQAGEGQNEEGQAEIARNPKFTTFKFREKEGWVQRTIDYIFMATNNAYEGVFGEMYQYLDPSDLEKDGVLNKEIGYPNASHPSDHFSIGYKITFLD